mgnify:CR=1 FL=1
MKKILLFLILSFLFNSNSFAKIDSSYEKQIYEGCINDAKQNNDYNSASRKFCKCYANQFDKKFNNEQLINFLSKSDQAKAQIVQNEIAPPCYPKSKKKNKNSTNSSKIITLKKCYDIESLQNFAEAIEVFGMTEKYYEVNLKNETVSDVMVRNGVSYIDTFTISDVTSKLIATDWITKIEIETDLRLVLNLNTKKVEQHYKSDKIEYSSPAAIFQCE